MTLCMAILGWFTRIRLVGHVATDRSKTLVNRWDRFAEWMLNGPLTVLFGIFSIVIVAFWLPGYLSWPLWADHDVFAVLAQGWSAGEQPYRDRPTTNFPGPIYQAWIFGHLFGWGGSRVVYALDAILLSALSIAIVVWSRRRLGWSLPGVLAVAILVSTHASRDFAHAAQRDWQATAYGLFAILAVAGRERPRVSLLVSAAIFAFALICRPQIVLLVPAILAALPSWRVRWVWLVLLTGFGIVFMLPLLVNQLVGDFLTELRRLGGSGIYARPNTDHVAIQFDQFLAGGAWLLMLLALIVLRKRITIPVWPLVAMLGAWWYRPLSPFPHGYLDQPLRTVLAVVAMAVVAGLLRGLFAARFRLLGILVLALATVQFLPRCCEFDKCGKAWKLLLTGDAHRYVPKGYTKESIPGQHIYPWQDYRLLVDYLRTRTSPETPVANLLLAPTAINGAIGRRTPLHAESMMWLIIVGRPDHERFASEIRSSKNAIVVWRPAEWHLVPDWHCIPDVIQQHYSPIAHFGDIEVCERKPDDEVVDSP